MEFNSYKYKASPFAPKGGRLPPISSETIPCTRAQMIMATERDKTSASPPYVFHISKLILYSGLTFGKTPTFNFPARRRPSTTLTRALNERADDGSIFSRGPL